MCVWRMSLKAFAFVMWVAGCFPSGAGAESIDWTLVHNTTLRGLQHLYNLEVDSAMQSFASVSRMAPTDPRGPFFESMVHFYLYGLRRDERELSMFFDSSERVINVCDDLLDRNNKDATTKFFLGGIYGYRGLAYQTSGSILKAARDGRKGYLLLEEAVIEQPDLYDAHMGFGLFRYLIAKLPKSMRWILGILGFQGDLEGGLHSLELAARKGVYTRTEATVFLAQFLFTEGRQDSALRYLDGLRREYPQNTLFMVLDAAWQHRLGNFDEALASAHAAIAMNAKKNLHYGDDLAFSTLGSIHLTLNEFSTAADYFRQYLKTMPVDAKTPNQTLYRGGLACELAGDRETALVFYRKLKEPDAQNRSWDAVNYRRGRELLRRPISPTEILLIKAGNEHARKQYSEAIQTYQAALRESAGDVDAQARALYGILQSQVDAGMYADAIVTGQQVVLLNPPDEEWVIPHAWFKMGQAYVKQEMFAEARSSFKKVARYDDYDFQDRLERQTTDELHKLDSSPAK